MKSSPCFGKSGIIRFIPRFVHPSEPIRENYTNRPKSHNIENLLLIVEAEKTIQINSSVSNVYTFLHADFEGVDFYAASRYVHFTE